MLRKRFSSAGSGAKCSMDTSPASRPGLCSNR